MSLGGVRGQPLYLKRMAATVSNSAWIEWMSTLFGGVSRQAHAATFPPDRYYCLLDELPLHLLPRSSRLQLRGESTNELYLNPGCNLLSAESLPEAFADQAEVFSAFALQGTIALVQDQRTDSMLPFWLGPGFEKVVRGLRVGEQVLSSVPQEIRSVLAAAGILIPQDLAGDLDRRHWVTEACTSFQEKGYAPLSELI